MFTRIKMKTNYTGEKEIWKRIREPNLKKRIGFRCAYISIRLKKNYIEKAFKLRKRKKQQQSLYDCDAITKY